MLAAAALAGVLGAAPAWAEPRSYTIDPDHFAIGFQVDHLGYADVIGMFLKASGRFEYDEATRTLKSGRVVVAADSVFSNHEARDRHVRDSDFLDAEEASRDRLRGHRLRAGRGDATGAWRAGSPAA